MHAGNIFAALMSWLIAHATGGSVVLRIEDLDRERSRPDFANRIMSDFEALGLTWDAGPYFQSSRTEAYESAFSALQERGLVYPCFCSRADIRAASAPHPGEKTVYPGTCAHLTQEQRAVRARSKQPAMRLSVPDSLVEVSDMVQGAYAQNLARECGDFLVKRADGGFAYQLAVVVDDADEGVTCVVRGVDLLASTPQQMHLQQLLGLAHPRYAHVPLLVSAPGKRLSKRDKAASLEELLMRFRSPAGVIGHIAWLCGLMPKDEPAMPGDLLQTFDPKTLADAFPNPIQIQWR